MRVVTFGELMVRLQPFNYEVKYWLLRTMRLYAT